ESYSSSLPQIDPRFRKDDADVASAWRAWQSSLSSSSTRHHAVQVLLAVQADRDLSLEVIQHDERSLEAIHGHGANVRAFRRMLDHVRVVAAAVEGGELDQYARRTEMRLIVDA